jgi:hypothetical protein
MDRISRIGARSRHQDLPTWYVPMLFNILCFNAFLYLLQAALDHLSQGHMLADVVAIIGKFDIDYLLL